MPHHSAPLRRLLAIAAMLAFAAACAFGCLWVTDQIRWQHRDLGVGLYPLRLVLVALCGATLLAAFVVCVGWPDRSRWWRRGCTVGFATGFGVLSLEVVFMWVGQSHNVGYTLAANVWWERWWGTENSLGYRDAEPTVVPGRKTVFCVGDSFTAGGGIAERADRFGDVLGRMRPDLHVLNLGHCGDDTAAEYEHLVHMPLAPDLVVLQYYPNDVDGASRALGHRMPVAAPYEDLPWVKLRFLVRGSFLANFVYWQLPHSDGLAYERFLADQFADAQVMARHADNLARICDWCEARHVPLVAVVFPLLADLDWSRANLGPVKDVFARRHVPVLDVTDLVAELAPERRCVNHHDGHASVEVHHRVGARLAELVPR